LAKIAENSDQNIHPRAYIRWLLLIRKREFEKNGLCTNQQVTKPYQVGEGGGVEEVLLLHAGVRPGLGRRLHLQLLPPQVVAAEEERVLDGVGCDQLLKTEKCFSIACLRSVLLDNLTPRVELCPPRVNFEPLDKL
jgi:hypothetical protein